MTKACLSMEKPCAILPIMKENKLICSASSDIKPISITVKKVGKLPVNDSDTLKKTNEIVYGLTSLSPDGLKPQLLNYNRNHYDIESHHCFLDWNWNEQRCTIRKGYGPENITNLRSHCARFFTSIAATHTTRAR